MIAAALLALLASPFAILHPGDLFSVEVVTPSEEARAEALRGAEIVSGPVREGETLRWTARCAGGPCEVAVRSSQPSDAWVFSYPVCLDCSASREIARGDVTLRFVETTHGTGIEVFERGRRAASVAPLALLAGNGDGAVAREARFEAEYVYVGAHENPPRAHLYGEMIGLWRVHVECVLLEGGAELSFTVTPRFDCRLSEIRPWPMPEATGVTLRKGSVLRARTLWRLHQP